MHPHTAYKILTVREFEQLLAGTFHGAPVDMADGYIHLSTAAQLDETLAKHFAGRDDLIIASVSLPMLGEALRWEPSRGGDLFPHYYGRLEAHHLSAHCILSRDEEGRTRLP